MLSPTYSTYLKTQRKPTTKVQQKIAAGLSVYVNIFIVGTDSLEQYLHDLESFVVNTQAEVAEPAAPYGIDIERLQMLKERKTSAEIKIGRQGKNPFAVIVLINITLHLPEKTKPDKQDTGMRMALANKEDLEGLNLFYQIIQLTEHFDADHTWADVFENEDAPELPKSLRFWMDQEKHDPVDWFQVLTVSNQFLLKGWFRVVMGFEVYKDNVQHPEKDYLAFKPEIEAGFEAIEILKRIDARVSGGKSLGFLDEEHLAAMRLLRDLEAARADNSEKEVGNE